MIFGIGIGVKKLTDCPFIQIKIENINIINEIISYIFMLESENKLKNIEYKFYFAIIYWSLEYYDLNVLNNLINKGGNNIKQLSKK